MERHALLDRKNDVSDDVFILSCHKMFCSATLDFHSLSEHYMITPTSGPDDVGLHILSAYNKSQTGSVKMITKEEAHDLNAVTPPLPRMNSAMMLTDTSVDTDLIIDVGVIYTPQARVRNGGR